MALDLLDLLEDAHAGPKVAIEAVLLGAGWQRSSVNLAGGGTVPLVHLRRRGGPWQRDLTGPAADPSLPAAAFLDRPVGVVLRAPG